MESTVALRQEKLDVQAVQGRGTGRVKARAGALSLPSSRMGVQLALTSKCAPALHQPHRPDFLASSEQVLHMLQTGTSMHDIAVMQSSAGRCPQRNFPGDGTQLGWTVVLCLASRQAPNGVLRLRMLTIRQSCQAGASGQHQWLAPQEEDCSLAFAAWEVLRGGNPAVLHGTPFVAQLLARWTLPYLASSARSSL